jgi:amino acid transporter
LQNVAVGLKLVLIAGFVAVGFVRMPARVNLVTADPCGVTFTAFAVTLVWISFAYSGWNAAVYVAGDVRDPERSVPRSLVLSTAVVTVVYLALNAVFLYSAPVVELAGRADIGVVAAQALGGVRLRRVVSSLVALALFTALSAMVMAASGVYVRMAQDGLLPRRLAVGDEAPTPAVALHVGLAVVVVWVSGLAELLGYIGFTLGLSAAATVGGLLVLRRREGPQQVPIPGYPWVPGLFILVTLTTAGLMAARQPFEAGLGVLTAAIGVPIYWLMRCVSRRDEAAGEEITDGRPRYGGRASLP